MRFVRGFFQFWWDFIVGDDWKIAAAVVATLVVGALVASSASAGSSWLAPAAGVAVILAFISSLVIDVRQATKSS